MEDDRTRSRVKDADALDGIAVVAIGCRLPGGANTPDQFWRMLSNGVDAITEVPRDRFDASELFDPEPGRPGTLYSRWGGFADGIDEFDAEFFGISPREAVRVDPQQRLLLQVVWEALEDGGLPADRLAGSNTGVFIGISTHDYGDRQINPSNRLLIDSHSSTGTALSIAANRVSYVYDLRGPSMAIDTACSSSLTAVHLACRSLRLGECDMAIAGGVNVVLNPETAIGFCRASMLSHDGRCKAFDARADGFVRGEGAAVVVLKPLTSAIADRDRIYAVVRGSAINQDGRTVGMTVPSVDAQERLIRAALRDARVPASSIQYVEAHGTGTRVGDPIETAAIGRALSPGRSASEPCLVGSVKTNVGHLEAAAGIAGFVKATLAVAHRQIPPSLHFTAANPAIPFDDLGIRVATSLQPWPVSGGPARAGVNSFGFGGANAHVVVEQAPDAQTASTEDRASAYILPISARHPEALRRLAAAYRERVADRSASLTDLCYSAALHRSHHPHRIAMVGATRQDLLDQLDALPTDAPTDGTAARRGGPPKTAFVFTGMGTQWWAMGRQLLEHEPVFRSAVERCDRLSRELVGWPLVDTLTADEATSRVNQADVAVLANFAIQMALVELWRSWGIVADAIVGHSAGEIAAACAAGALTLEDAVRLAFHRGRLQQRATGTGTMLGAGISESMAAELAARFDGRVSIGAVNSPTSVTLSGDRDALEAIASKLTAEGRFNRFLRVDIPYHGPQMDALRDELLASLATLVPRSPTTPWALTASGTWAEAPPGADYWFDNLRRPVRFADAVNRLVDAGCDHFVEIGPHPALGSSIAECLNARGKVATVLPTLRRMEDERLAMLRTLGVLYSRGCGVNWASVQTHGAFVPLPRYPWQRDRHWFEGGPDADRRPSGAPTGHPLLGSRLRSARHVWEADLDRPQLAYLDDHVVQGSPVFPAAAYAEMAFAAAGHIAPEATPSVEDFVFHKVLFLANRSERIVQLTADAGGGFEIHSAPRNNAGEWTRHASGKLRTSRVDAPQDVDVAAIQARCETELQSADVYRALEARGLSYKGLFRGIEALWRREGEALARLALPDDGAASATPYRIHPALLDAALQTLLGAAGSVSDLRESSSRRLFLPTGIRRIRVLRTPPSRCWSHATLVDGGGDTLLGHVTIVEPSGAVAATIEGLHCKALEDRARTPVAGLADVLYHLSWELKPLDTVRRTKATPVAASTVVAERVRDEVARLASETGADLALQQAEPTLNAMVAHYARAALRSLGCDLRVPLPDAQQLADRLGIVASHRRFFARLVDIVREVPTDDCAADTAADERAAAARLADRVIGEHAGCETVIELLRRSGERLDTILSGKVDAREVLFTPAALVAWTRFFADVSWYKYYNTVVANAVAAAVAAVPSETPVRILEVGAGTGGTTMAVLARLEGRAVDYHFTDLSKLFLAQARERYRHEPHVHVAPLDIEADPIPQVGAEPFDIVLAANVLHATADLRSSLEHVKHMLAPGGLLVLLEVCRQTPWPDLIFGVTEGWWRFTDVDLRPDHALLTSARWHALLADAGFEGATAVSDPGGNPNPIQAVTVATLARGAAARVAEGPSSARNWLVLADARGVGERIRGALSERGDRSVLVVRGGALARRSLDTFEVPMSSAEHLAWVVDEVVSGQLAIDGVIHAWSLDAPPPATLSGADMLDWQERNCSSVVHLLQAFEAGGRTTPPFWVVTAGACRVDSRGDDPDVTQAPVWGLQRALASERQDAVIRTVDLSADCTDEDVHALVDELCGGAQEEEVAVRGSDRYVPKLRRRDPELQRRLPLSSDAHTFGLDVDAPGDLATLTLREKSIRAPGPGEVSIRVLAAGVNFRDVMLSLGVLPPMAIPGAGRTVLGFECAGIVLECGAGVEHVGPGDAVVAVAMGAFASRVITRGEMVAPKPAHLTFEEAATIPLVFVTAHYGLNHLARMSKGERVLIHAATGGVGLAAVQLARRAGAAIFATAGSPEKRRYLQSLGVEHVMDSRSLAFADDILAATGGEGVDVVLNSLTGDAIAKGLSVLRPYGRFIEIGKRDIYADTPIGLLPFDKNISFSSIALDRMCLDRPAVVGSMLREVMALFTERVLDPLPHTAYDLADAEQAFRLLAQAKHIGKLVLTVREPAYQVTAADDRPLCRQDGTYVITGGLGGVGLAVAGWMVDHGARHIVLMSRRGVPLPENAAAFDALRQSAAEIVVVKGDVGEARDVHRLLEDVRATRPPLRGIVHAAMVIDDAPAVQLAAERLRAVLAPKVAGAWILHQMTAADDLDFFVMFSSAASVLGTAGQGNYAAANIFLDALAQHRRSLGLPALTINWGAFADIGYVARHEQVALHVARAGMQNLTPAEALTALEQSLRREWPQVVAARFDWQRWSARHATSAVKKSQRLVDFATAVPTEAAEAFTDRGSALSLVSVPDVERRPMAERLISERLARVLGASAAKLNVDVPLTDMGVDSLMAVELQTVIARDFGVQVPLASLLERATVAHLAETVLEQMKLDGPTSGSPAGAPTVASTPSSRQPAATASLPSDAMSTPTRSAVDSAEATPPIAVQCELASPTPIASGAIARSREIVRSEPSLRRQRGNTPIDYATLDYSRLTRAQAFTRTVLTSAFRAAGRVNVEGLENLPAEGPVIVAINHLCAMDLPLLFTILPRRGVCLAAERLQSSILIRRFLDLGQSIYVRRGEADEKALADALAVLRAGGLVGLAPEGTRSRSGGLTRGHSGVAYLAAEAPAPILPIAAYGQERLGDNLRRLRRTEIHVRAGSLMAPTAGEKTAASLARDTERVMVALASMLPPKYRGVYASAVEPIERALDDMAAVL